MTKDRLAYPDIPAIQSLIDDIGEVPDLYKLTQWVNHLSMSNPGKKIRSQNLSSFLLELVSSQGTCMAYIMIPTCHDYSREVL